MFIEKATYMNEIFKLVIQFNKLDQSIQINQGKTPGRKEEFDRFCTALYMGFKF